jgi:hypothetical protein
MMTVRRIHLTLCMLLVLVASTLGASHSGRSAGAATTLSPLVSHDPSTVFKKTSVKELKSLDTTTNIAR